MESRTNGSSDVQHSTSLHLPRLKPEHLAPYHEEKKGLWDRKGNRALFQKKKKKKNVTQDIYWMKEQVLWAGTVHSPYQTSVELIDACKHK